jgi:3-dehydroquinate synthase class II
MRRSYFCSVAVLGIFAAGLAMADESKLKNDKEKNHNKATIAKVDAAKGTIEVTSKDQDGKEIEKTLQLAEGAEYFDCNSKAVKIDAFQPGDHVLITEKDGKIKELKKCKDHAQATITKVDAKKGTVAVTMKDKQGKEVDKTFQLMDDAEYFDSTGRVAVIDVFQSGDEVLIVETDGKIQELQKDSKGKAGDKDKTPLTKKSDRK